MNPATAVPSASAIGASIHLSEVSRRYGQADAEIIALDAVSLTIAPGEAVALMGPSGSGKSTLLYLVGAMDRPSTGAISVNGCAIEALDPGPAAAYRRTVGFVFQRFHLLAALSVLDNVLAPLIPIKMDHDPEPRARTLLSQVGLSGREAATPGQLSGGQQQRVAIARALINNPIVLLADEPTGNLDSSTGAEVLDLLLAMRAAHHTTLLIATHDSAVAERCDRIVRLADGRIQEAQPRS
jgi:putative ABC transport system ATP-binding protein